MRQFMDDAETRDSTINANFLNKYKHVGFKEEDLKFKGDDFLVDIRFFNFHMQSFKSYWIQARNRFFKGKT